MSSYTLEALEYIAKLADGGMRDAITLMDKCLSYSSELTLENVVKVIGTVDYNTMMQLTDSVVNRNVVDLVQIVEDTYNSGKDIKQFVKLYIQFLLDVVKFSLGCSWKHLQIPRLTEYEDWMKSADVYTCRLLMSDMINLNSDIKYSSTPKFDLEEVLILACYELEE